MMGRCLILYRIWLLSLLLTLTANENIGQENSNLAKQGPDKDAFPRAGGKRESRINPEQDISQLLDACNVNWDVPGPTSAQSMPIGNGNIGLNVWVEQNGDLAFYIGKTDSWSENVYGAKGLMKVGGMHLSLSPNPLVTSAPFLQLLRLHEGEIQIKEGDNINGVQLRVWVDANNPVIRVEVKSRKPVSAKVTLDDWRIASGGDTVISYQGNSIAWYHRNSPAADPHVAGLIFGAVIKGKDLESKDDRTLQSGAATSHLISVYPLTMASSTVKQWKTQLKQQIAGIDKLDLEQTRLAHQVWWDQFWHRSWVFIQGDQSAFNTTHGYVLQRFVTACAGRGAYPIKFNGSIFMLIIRH